MKSLIIITSFLLSLNGYAQKEKKLLFDKAFSFYYGVDLQDSTNINFERNFDSSLIYLLRLNKKYPNYRRTEILDEISVCYFEKKEYSKSLTYALQVLLNFKTNNIESDDYCFDCNSACYRIGYIYQLQQQYEKALSYYDSCSTKYTTPPAFCSISYYLNKVPADYNLFSCYMGLGQHKVALAKLTPYMFDSTINGYLDTSIINDYVKVLSRLYSKVEIKKNIQSAIDNMYYHVEMKNNRDSLKYDYKITCWFKLFDSKIVLTEAEAYGRDKNEVDDFDTKENLVERIKKSEGYKRLFVQ